MSPSENAARDRESRYRGQKLKTDCYCRTQAGIHGKLRLETVIQRGKARGIAGTATSTEKSGPANPRRAFILAAGSVYSSHESPAYSAGFDCGRLLQFRPIPRAPRRARNAPAPPLRQFAR